MPLTPVAEATSDWLTSGEPLIDADVIDGAADTLAVPDDVADAEPPVFVSVMVTVIESPVSELWTV